VCSSFRTKVGLLLAHGDLALFRNCHLNNEVIVILCIRPFRAIFVTGWRHFLVTEPCVFLVSVSEPLAVPEGHKVIVTAMEIGLIRDIVDRALMFHDTVISENNIFGKTYNFCFSSVYKTVTVADSVVKSTDKIYQDTFPGCKLH